MIQQLKYGDRIRLYWEKGARKFYLSSDGVATSRVFFRRSLRSDKEKDAFQDNDTFIVVPANESRALNRLKADIHACKKDVKSGKIIKGTERETREGELLRKGDTYDQEVPEEVVSNWAYHKSMMGTSVSYNQIVQLVHEKTQEYVRISKKVDLSLAHDPEDKSSPSPNKADFMRIYSLKLDPCSGPETQFMLTPCFKYQEKDAVLIQDSFCLTYRDTRLLGKYFYLDFKQGAESPNQSVGKEAYVGEDENKVVLNFYLTEEEKSPVRFEFCDNKELEGHLFEKLHRRAIWVTHIQAPMYLSLRRVVKASDQDENSLSDLVEQVDEALSQALSLSFREFNPSKPIPSDGLWIGYASKSPNEVIFRHLQYILTHPRYEVWLKPLQLEQLVRTSTEVGAISQGSIFKIKVRDTGAQVQLKEQVASKKTLIHKRELVMDDYYKSFKVIVVSEERQHILLTLTDLARYIRTFDVETEKRHSDFSNDALLKLLSKALRRLKQLCINALPSTIQTAYPYKYPIEFIQQVCVGLTLVHERNRLHRLCGRSFA